MKKLLKMSLILTGIFMTATSFAQTSADPNVPVLPTQPQPATPAKAAAPAPIQLISPEVTKKRSDMFSYAVSNVTGVTADENGKLTADKNWLGVENGLKYTGGIMQVETKEFTKGDKAIFTVSKKDGRSTVAIFEGNEAESYTVVNNETHYTVTPAFCEILRAQTQSRSFDDLKNTALICENFYDRPALKPNQLEAIPSILEADKRNLAYMKKSIAKDSVPASPEKYFGEFGRKMNRLGKKWGMNSTVDPKNPRAILTKASSEEEKADRMIIAEVANACANLWPDGYDDGTPKKVPPPKKTAPAAPAKVTK